MWKVGHLVGAVLLVFCSVTVCAKFEYDIPVPDLSLCKPMTLFSGAVLDCCPVVLNKTVREFHFENQLPFRIRPAAHLLDEATREKINRAYEIMKSLPEDDPRSFLQQQNLHCSYCGGNILWPDIPDKVVQIHSTWLFLPWHRWFLYFHERILAHLIGDPTFALPFWNWDNNLSLDASMMPALYVNYSAMYHPVRSALHQPPAIVNLGCIPEASSPTEQLQCNGQVMYEEHVVGMPTAQEFHGYPFIDMVPEGSKFQSGSHRLVHMWVGDELIPGHLDMGPTYSSANDPIFYAHHGNVDRLWDIRTKKLGLPELYHPDFLNTEFVFYDENADIVRVRTADCMQSVKLGYAYQEVDIEWIGQDRIADS